MNSNELIRILMALGAVIDRSHGKGGHMKVKLNGRVTFVPMHGTREIPTGTFHSICRQLGIDPQTL